ncbi:uncharacterized protein LOC123529858 isoform X1 [Mercenaria mercenaria]|uniref:uncharacterized protein LOC123529858 isoform X1 n=1 Tax=Mercenaria mercenaria TaxID=6596 RepID=UPI00234EFFBA|nr:uncharacterized protein LOC123529858 isoform X1 [Mercenaria mercenaria]
MAERDAKRLKTQKDGSPRIFKTFKRDCVKSTDLLLSAVSALERGLEGLSFAMLKVDTSNAQKQHSFVDVSIEYSPWNMFGDEEPHSGCNIGALFSDGLEVLKSYADMDSPKVPKLNLVQRTALQNLLEFLSKKIDHETLFEEISSEEHWCVVLAQHLLSKLAVSSEYTIASYPGLRIGDTKCMCKQNDDLVGVIGDTSFGLENGWHGNTDIIFEGADVQVACMRDEEDQDDLSVSSMEMEASDFNFKDFKQIVAQTIVFSFLQKKTCGNKLKNSLIPGIGMSKKKLIVVFYDAENDILLSTKPILLFGDKEIVYSALVFLWLTLNYKEFCTGIPDALKEFKASFLPDPVLHQMYIERVERPLHIDHTKEEKAFPWSDKNVRTVVGKKPEVVLSDLSEDES